MKEKYRQSETVTIKRSQINFAPYNPKNHSDEQVAQIKKNIKNVAFLGGIVWNEQTGNLIDGHKRIMSLDLINKGEDYDIKVEKISLDEKTEKEQNIFQTKSRTDLDYNLVADMIQDIDYRLAGLDDYDLSMMDIQMPELPNQNYEPDPDADRKSDIKGKKAAVSEKAAKEAGEGENYIMLSFDSYKNKAAFMYRFGFDPGDKYIKGEEFSEMVERIE